MLTDQFGRSFSYIRLSLTDSCNFRCQYCLPHGWCGDKDQTGPMNMGELTRLITALAEMGVRKIRLTGGEPTLRSDLLAIISMIATHKSFGVIAMTTNGFRLARRLPALRAAGLNHINISLDSVNPERFLELTGKNSCNEIKLAVDQALELNFQAVKINTVLMKDYSYQEFDDFLGWIKQRPVSLRFIELMQTSDNIKFFRDQHIRACKLREKLGSSGWSRLPRKNFAGPSEDFAHPDYAGTVGIIAPYDKSFCTACNRLRITAKGELRLCLFGDKNHDLRPLLQRDIQRPDLKERICDLLRIKQESHHLNEGDNGSTRHFAAIGG